MTFYVKLFSPSVFSDSPTLQHVLVLSSILWLNNIPLLCVCHILFLHSSIVGHRGCFKLIVIMNNGTMDIHVWTVFVWILVLSSFGYISRSGIVGAYVNSIFSFLRSHWKLFSTVAVWFYIPTNNIWEFKFLKILVNTPYFPLFLLLPSKWV